jgi:hypothetical protein
MKNNISIHALFLLLLFCVADAKAECSRLDLESFLEHSRAAINFTGDYFPSPKGIWLEDNIDKKPIQWLGATWYGPESGALFIVDCSGKIVTAAAIGAVFKLSPFNLNADLRNAVIVEYTPATGTGFQMGEVSIFNFIDNKLNKIWTHNLYEYTNFNKYEPQTETEYKYKISQDGKKIVVFGTDKIYPLLWDGKDKSKAKVKKSLDTFCWDASGTYKSCK